MEGKEREKSDNINILCFFKVYLGCKCISKVEEYNLNLNNTAYVLREICF